MSEKNSWLPENIETTQNYITEFSENILIYALGKIMTGTREVGSLEGGGG